MDKEKVPIGGEKGTVGNPEHSRAMERIAILEKGMETVEKGVADAVTRLEQVRDLTIEEFKIIRKDITDGILSRYPAGVVWVVSILTGTCTALTTALFMKI